jgi:predicted amidohydrolase
MNCYTIQYDIIWENPGQNLSGILHLLQNHQIEKESLVVLPEMFATGFSMNSSEIAQSMDGSIVNWMKVLATTKNILLAGSVAIKENDHYYNRFLWVFPDGKIEYYDKKHLFALGGEQDSYTQGNVRKILNYQGFAILPLICYDLRFPIWSRNHNDYDLIVYSSNWPTSRKNAWNALLPARAIENQAYVIGANRIGSGNDIACCGGSQIIDYKGVILEKAGEEQTQIIHSFLSKDKLLEFREKYPFWKDADPFELK